MLSIAEKPRLIYNSSGKIKISAKSKSTTAIKWTLLTLTAISIFAFLTFDYEDVNIIEATIETFRNFYIAFFTPRLKTETFFGVLSLMGTTFSLGILSTLLGAVIAFFCALSCATNLANPKVSLAIKVMLSVIRAIPTILWVFIFAVTSGLGSIAGVMGLTFHSISYLTKAYSEAIEEMDFGVVEALRASGASYWQIVFQAILPTISRVIFSWTFMRFELNYKTAVTMGAAAGIGGIGYSLFMAGNFYFDLRETGFITLAIVVSIILLEIISTKLKEKIS